MDHLNLTIVSRIEAITAAVRLMGLREQAESAAEMSNKIELQRCGQNSCMGCRLCSCST